MSANLAAFQKGLAENGYNENKNVRIEYRWAEGKTDRLPALAAELVHLPVAVIAATRTAGPAMAAKAATSTIPIVFETGSDPVKDGLVASLNRPGGNVTGAFRVSAALIQKRLNVILELTPRAKTIGLLVNPNDSIEMTQVKEMQEAVQARGLSLYVARVSNERELDGAFAGITQAGATYFLKATTHSFLTDANRSSR